MTVADYLFQSMRIFETLIIAGITARCLKVIITQGIEEDDWPGAMKRSKRLVLAAICTVCVAEFLGTIRKIYGG